MRSLLVVLIPAGALFAQTPAVSLDHESKHHIVLANEWVRVFDVVVPAGDSTLYHVHANDYVYVTFGAVTLQAQAMGSASAELALADGEVRFTKGPITHRVVNRSATPFHNLTVEVLKTPGVATGGGGPAGDGRMVVLENDRVRVERIVLEPGQATRRHEHRGPSLDVAVSPGTVTAVGASGASRRTYKSGDYQWTDRPRSHTLTNAGTARIELVEIDWK